MTSLDFSFATRDDAPAVVALVESAYRGDDSRGGWTTEADLLDGQRTDVDGVLEQLANPAIELLLARQDGELVACCELHVPPRGRHQLVPERVAVPAPAGSDDPAPTATAAVVHGHAPDVMADGVAYFGMFAVKPGLQGGGVGRRFLAEAERIAREEWGADELQMTVIHLREELIEWYERRGFHRTGRQKPFPYGDERFGIPARDDLHLDVLSKPLA